MNVNEKSLAQEAMENTPKISCDEYKKMQSEGVAHVLLDVREDDEWDAGHIEGAVHIPRGFLEFKVEEAIPEKSSVIVICCARGGRAALAGQTLKEMGYTDVRYLEGGYSGYCE